MKMNWVKIRNRILISIILTSIIWITIAGIYVLLEHFDPYACISASFVIILTIAFGIEIKLHENEENE